MVHSYKAVGAILQGRHARSCDVQRHLGVSVHGYCRDGWRWRRRRHVLCGRSARGECGWWRRRGIYVYVSEQPCSCGVADAKFHPPAILGRRRPEWQRSNAGFQWGADASRDDRRDVCISARRRWRGRRWIAHFWQRWGGGQLPVRRRQWRDQNPLRSPSRRRGWARRGYKWGGRTQHVV